MFAKVYRWEWLRYEVSWGGMWDRRKEHMRVEIRKDRAIFQRISKSRHRESDLMAAGN